MMNDGGWKFYQRMECHSLNVICVKNILQNISAFLWYFTFLFIKQSIQFQFMDPKQNSDWIQVKSWSCGMNHTPKNFPFTAKIFRCSHVMSEFLIVKSEYNHQNRLSSYKFENFMCLTINIREIYICVRMSVLKVKFCSRCYFLFSLRSSVQ